MFGEIPVAYVIKLTEIKWYLRLCDEDTRVCTWTKSSVKAKTFQTRSNCQEYISKYLNGRDVTIDEKILNPYAAMAAAYASAGGGC